MRAEHGGLGRLYGQRLSVFSATRADVASQDLNLTEENKVRWEITG